MLKGYRMGHSGKVSLKHVALLLSTRFRFFILEQVIVTGHFHVILRLNPNDSGEAIKFHFICEFHGVGSRGLL